MNKKFILDTFNSHFNEFINDILYLFPKEVDLMTANTFLSGILKVKKQMIIQCWYYWIYLKYSKELESGDFNFFLNKNYMNDVGKNNRILNSIEKMRKKCRSVSDNNKEKITLYVKNLSKLSKIYYS